MLVHAPPAPVGRAHHRPSLEVADIVRAHRDAFVRTHVLTPEQHAVLRDIARCRTAELGGHLDVCAACGSLEGISYNSCRNRHCPKCQSLAQYRWVEQRLERMLPTHCFHVVFTLPRQLRRLALANPRVVFDLLFAGATATLLELGRDPHWLGAELGITSVLHTWQRDLRFHPHLHCIVTGGGLSPDGTRWIAAPSNFLFHVRVMGELFRGKMLAALRQARDRRQLRFVGPAASLADPDRFDALFDQLAHMRWVVYCKPPLGDRDQVFRYLGRYTHRVGLSNQRLVAFDSHLVTFRTRGEQKVTLAPEEFLRRFLLHVLPRGFVKIRHHGLFAPGHVPTKLAAARRLLSAQPAAPAAAAPPPRPASDRAPRDFRELVLALLGLELRRCSRCGAHAVVRRPLAELGPTLRPASTPPPPDTS